MHPITTVEVVISSHFFNNHEENLIVAGGNLLRVYRIFPCLDSAQRERLSANGNTKQTSAPKMRLECLGSYTMFGNIMSVQSISLTGSQRDTLLVSFKDAKLSVVQHDPDTYSLQTLSMHFFEEEEIRCGWINSLNIPLLRVDPENRCAVMLVYGKQLVVLPFRKENTLDEIEMTDIKPIKKSPFAIVTRSPILASYLIALRDLDDKIDNVIDLQFLYGYYEPTLLILYEPVRTFPGRVAVRADTSVLVAISINIQQRVHPIIWTVSGLPFDCLRVFSINKPIGGCLVITANAIIYLNQSVPPNGISLNSSAEPSTAFPLKPQDGVSISLDSSNIAFIDTDKLVISLKTGELYVLTLCIDSMRTVRNFHFHKAAASILTSCICVLNSEYMFLGSRLGNSLLLHFTEEDHSTVITLDETELLDEVCTSSEHDQEVPSKLCRIEDEELEVYGSNTKTSVQLCKYVFEVCDSLLNVGPISFMCAGERIDYEEDGCTLRPPVDKLEMLNIELVASTGHSKNGALCVFVNTIQPQVITSFELVNCLDVWTVYGDNDMNTAHQDHHVFMILSTETSTLVLQTGEEINEIENTGFCNTERTIGVGNLGQNRFIVQVTSRNVRLLQATRLVQNVPIDTGLAIVQVALVDPYVCLRLASGQVITLALRETRNTPRLAINKNTVSNKPAVIALSLYKDLSGMFSAKTEDLCGHVMVDPTTSSFIKTEPHLKIEDEEDLLYGESGNALKMNSMAKLVNHSMQKRCDWWRRLLPPTKPTFWLVLARANGMLEIYSMPDVRLVYMVNDVGNGAKVFTDAMEFVAVPCQLNNAEDQFSAKQECKVNMQNECNILPLEIQLIGLGYEGTRPLLLIRTAIELLIYQAFHYSKGHLKVRFRKLDSVNLINQSPTNTQTNDDAIFFSKRLDRALMRPFENLAGMNGIALCGINSCLIFLTIKGELRIHRLSNTVEMRCFATFNNINCPHGFLYFDNTHDLKISVLPAHLIYDAPWPVRKIALRCTPRQLIYHRENRVYCLITQTEQVTTTYYRFNGEDKELCEENKGERFIYPNTYKFSMVLVSPETWEIVPDAAIHFDTWEHVTAFKVVKLAYEGTRSGFKEYICIGTNFNYSEDITSRGNILIYDIIEVVPEPGKPLTKFKLKEVFKKEQKGPVSAIADVLGFLVTALGQKIYLWQLKDDDLIGVAFIDTNIYVHQIISVKSLILIADIYKSVSLLRFQEEFRTLSLASQDFNPLEVFDIEFVIDNTNLGFLVSDTEQNFITFMYQPESRESLGGQKLIRKADYHLGQTVNTMFRMRCHQRGLHQRHPFTYEGKHLILFGTLDGSIGFCLPLPEKIYRRFLMLQNVLLTYQEHLCGLNPKEYRTVKTTRKLSLNPSRCIIDGDLIWCFKLMSNHERNEVTKKIGSRIGEILSDLLEIERMTSVF